MNPERASGPGRTELADALELERRGTDVFRGVVPPTPVPQIYGGHLVGQATVAATRTVRAEHRLHSLQTYFLRPGRADQSLDYRVHRLRDGGTLSTRMVAIYQGGQQIAQVSASFIGPHDGAEHQVTMPPAPDPKEVPSLPRRVDADPQAWPALYRFWEHFDIRYVVAPRDRLAAAGGGDPDAQVWLKTLGAQDKDLDWHACALAYVSDLTLLSVTLPVQSLRPALPGLQMASLDHSVWFHQPCRVDDWLLYDQTAPAVAGGLGLACGRLFRRDGTLVASVMQQGLVRMAVT